MKQYPHALDEKQKQDLKRDDSKFRVGRVVLIITRSNAKHNGESGVLKTRLSEKTEWCGDARCQPLMVAYWNEQYS